MREKRNLVDRVDFFGGFGEAGLRIVKLELLSNPVHIPWAGRDLPPSRLGITGVKLLAIKDPEWSAPA